MTSDALDCDGDFNITRPKQWSREPVDNKLIEVVQMSTHNT